MLKVIGVQVDAIERGEDRIEFKKTMNKLWALRWREARLPIAVDEALAIADKLGYPVVLRPAYTMGGAGGGLVYNIEELKTVCATRTAGQPCGSGSGRGVYSRMGRAGAGSCP